MAKKLIYILAPIIILIIWKLIVFFGLANPIILPPPESVVDAFISELKGGELLKHIATSASRVLSGFLIASAIGIPLGLLMGWFRPVNIFFDGLIQALRAIPPIAWLPLAILWFGIGEASKIYIITYGAFFPIVLNTILGVRLIDKNLLLLAKSLNLKGFRLFKEVIFPGSLPSIFTGLRIGFGMSWMCLIAAELIAAQSGIGYMIEVSRLLLLTDRIILGMLIIGFLGLLTDKILRLVERKIIYWT